MKDLQLVQYQALLESQTQHPQRPASQVGQLFSDDRQLGADKPHNSLAHVPGDRGL